ncbi:MAG: tetratricopeptide repeat protein [bacterium]|nr:tetratricopeptide repeat protein [bacterium]
MKKLLFTLSLCALCAAVSPLPGWADTPYADSNNESPEIIESASPEADPELERLNKAGNDAAERKDYAEAVKYYREAAEKGSPKAQYNLGNCYSKGKGVDKDPMQAVYWYRQAAEQGFAHAQHNLGCHYIGGYGVDKDPVQGFIWVRKSAEQGTKESQNYLGALYLSGVGVEQNAPSAISWYRKAADQNDANAQLLLGMLYCAGNDLVTKAFLADMNISQDVLSLFTGLKTDLTEGKKWLQKAAANQEEDGQADAATAKEILQDFKAIEAYIADLQELNNFRQQKLAYAKDSEYTELEGYIQSTNKEITRSKAVLQMWPWLVLAAHKNDEGAAKHLKELRETLKQDHKSTNNLKNIYKAEVTNSISIPAEIYTNTKQYDNIKPYDAFTRGNQACAVGDPKGYALLESSARRGCNHAKIVLAWHFYPEAHKETNDFSSFEFEGKTLSEADRLQRYLKWMSSAADNGSVGACWELRNLYKEGKYVPKDSAKVFHYTKAAAQLKDPDAMFDLGTRYAQGIGCQKDRIAAVKWMKQAAHAGSAEAQQWIEDRRGHYVNGTETYKISSAQALQEARRDYPGVSTVSTYRDDPDAPYNKRVFLGILTGSTPRGPMQAPLYTISDGYGSTGIPYATGAQYGDIVLAGPYYGIELVDDRTRTRTVRKWQGPKIGGWEDLLR